MKKSTNKAISLGLASISILSPVLDSGIPVLAMSESSIKNDNSIFTWVSSPNHKSKVELSNDSSKGSFWFIDEVTKSIHAKGGTYINFIVNSEELNSPLQSIEIFSGADSLGKADNTNNFKILLADIPSDGSVEIVYTFEDGNKDRVSLYNYFSNISGGVTSHIIDDVNPTLSFESVNKDEGVEYDGKYFKGKLKYSFQSDTINPILPNIWGTTGYKFKLLINGEDYSDSRVFSVNHDSSSGKVDIGIDFNSILKSISGECNIDIFVLDNVGNEFKYSDTIFIDYSAPLVSGSTSSKHWLNSSDNITYFDKEDNVEVTYNVSDTESGVKTVTLLKNSLEVFSNNDSVGSFIINDEGVYQLKVEDNLGNMKTYGLSEIIEGVSDEIKFDNSVPVVSLSENGLVNTDWFVKESSLSLEISDDIGLQSLKYYINDIETNISLDGNPKSKTISIDSSSLKGISNKLKIDVIAVDILGKEKRLSSQYNVDVDSPILENAKLSGDISVIEGKGYSKTPIEITGIAKDSSSGIASVDILKDGVSVSNSLPYTIYADGNYSIKIVDNVGNETVSTIQEISGKEFNGIIIDGNPPKIEATINNSEVLDSWYKDKATLSIVSKDNKNIKSIRYSINGSETSVDVNDKSHSLNINLEDHVDERGIVEIEYSVIDTIGNESSYFKTIRLDKNAPKIENAKLDGNIFMVGNIAFIKGSVILSADILDSESKIAKVEVINKGKVVSDSLPYTIEEDGVYSVRVTDNAGHVVTKTLKELLNTDIGDVVIDNNAPNISASIDGADILDDWYKDTAKFKLIANDESSIKSIKYSLNGEEFIKEVNSPSHEIDINLEDYVNKKGIVKINFEISDNLGNKSSYSKVVKLDTKDPELSNGELSGDVNIIDSIGYAKDTLTLSAITKDIESGITKIEIIKDSQVVGTELPYKISETGTYEVRLTDGVGHTVTKSIKELVGLDINKIIVDRGKPSISRLEGFEADLVKEGINWYNKSPNLKVSINDDNLNTISIKVNDVEVISSISEDGNYLIPIDNIEGSFKINITATDKSNNVSEDSYEFKVDLSNPTIDEGSLKGEYSNRGYGLYFAEAPVVTLKGSDSSIGVEEYVLLDKDKSEVSRNSSGVFTLSNGEYFAKTVDYFGNESDIVSIQDLCNLENNRLVIDNIAPVILSSRPEGGLDGWFNKNISYSINVSDNVGINNAKVLINGNIVDSFKADSDINKISLNANTEDVYKEDGKYIIEVIVEDNTGLTSEWSDTIYIDTTAPEFKGGNILGDYVDRGDSIVFAKTPYVKINQQDSGIGLESITLVNKDGVEVSNNEGLFELSSNEYFVVLEDKLGNKTKPTSLKEICNIPSNSIIIDTKKPIISTSRPNGINGDWFNDDVSYRLSVEDEIGLQNVKVSINGKEVIGYEFENKTSLKKEFEFSTKGVNPNSDGSYNVSISTKDIVGNESNWNDTIYIDTFAPVIEKFLITGKGYLEGDNINSSDKYGFYIQGKTDIEVHVSDGSYSSGMNTLYYDLISSDGSKESSSAKIINGVAKVVIDKEFKGYISAYATDNVGNIRKSNRPDGIISESSNTHINSSKIDIELPNTGYKDNKGNNLYKENVTLHSNIVDLSSGIRKVKWGINNDTKGTVYIDNDGNLVGDTGSIIKKDKNLVVEFTKDMLISNNENELSVWVEVTDRVGHVSKNNRILSIDKDAPIVNVSYDTNNENSFYNKNRVATVSIKERNFRSSDVKFNGVIGSIGEWSNIGNDTWICNIVFSEDNDYEWSVNYTDMAGNIGNSYNSEKFTIDKTSPVLNVSFDNNRVESGNFFKDTRVATVVVNEKNFNPSLVKLEGSGSLGTWSSNGDIHTANIVFDTDGEYEFSLGLSDKAGNSSSNFNSGKFIIDKTVPSLSISGVQNGVSYKKNVGFKVNLSDTYIDTERCSITLSGRSLGEVNLIGGINGTNGEFTFSGVPEDIKYDDLYTLKAVIYDKAGNFIEEIINYSINRYGSRFTFLDSHLLNNIINKPEDVTLEEISVDRLELDSCKVVVIKDGKTIPIDEKYIRIEELGGVDSNWVYRYFVDKKAFNEDGKYQVQVFSKSLDGSSNSSLSQEYSFILDTTNPEIIISGVENESSYREVSRKVAIEVRDLSGVGSIKAFLNGKEVSLVEEDGVYSLVIPESSKKQNLVVEVVDRAGNTSTIEVNDFLVTSNVVLSIINSSLAKGLLSGLGVALLVLIGILLKRRKDSKKEELELAQEHAKMYHDSITGGSTNSGSNSTLDR